MAVFLQLPPHSYLDDAVFNLYNISLLHYLVAVIISTSKIAHAAAALAFIM